MFILFFGLFFFFFSSLWLISWDVVMVDRSYLPLQIHSRTLSSLSVMDYINGAFGLLAFLVFYEDHSN